MVAGWVVSNHSATALYTSAQQTSVPAPQASAAVEHHDWEDQHVLSINR